MSVLATGWTGAKEGRHPPVRWACVMDNLEFLRVSSNDDITHVFHLQGRGSGLVQNWLPSIPTLLSPSGCYISLEITFQPLRSSQPLITQVLAFDIFFLCCIVCRILILRPGIEVVPPAWEAQRHNYWVFLTVGHPGMSWCLHLRNSVVSINLSLASLSAGSLSWSTPATPSKLRPHPINTTQVTLSSIYSLPISQAGMDFLEDKISPFANRKTVTTVLDSYGLTRNTGSVTFYCCGSCICGN